MADRLKSKAELAVDEVFYKSLRDHPVPLQEAAIRELRDRSMSLDLYVWLAWRLHTLAKPAGTSASPGVRIVLS